MDDHSFPQEGFKPKLNYPKNRKSAKGKTQVSWIGTEVGRAAKIYIGLVGDERFSTAGQLDRAFKERGVTTDYLFHRITSDIPELNKWYRIQPGNPSHKPLDGKILFDRYHKMYYWNDAPTREQRGWGRRPEHYLESAKLRPHLIAVQALFKRGGPISLLELHIAGRR